MRPRRTSGCSRYRRTTTACHASTGVIIAGTAVLPVRDPELGGIRHLALDHESAAAVLGTREFCDSTMSRPLLNAGGAANHQKHEPFTTVSSLRREDAMTTQHDQAITKTLVGMAIALGCCVGGAAPASAAPSPAGTDPNPFGALSCSCRQTASPGSPALTEETERGIREGLSAV
jgi:hypothetical protein